MDPSDQHPHTNTPEFTLDVPAGLASPDETITLTSVRQVIAFYEEYAGFDSGVPTNTVVEELEGADVPPAATVKEIARLKQEGKVYSPESGTLRSAVGFDELAYATNGASTTDAGRGGGTTTEEAEDVFDELEAADLDGDLDVEDLEDLEQPDDGSVSEDGEDERKPAEEHFSAAGPIEDDYYIDVGCPDCEQTDVTFSLKRLNGSQRSIVSCALCDTVITRVRVLGDDEPRT